MFTLRDDLTKENILKKVDDFLIFRNYCTNFRKIGEMFNSEFRKDSNPSCVINYHNGKLWYRDFGDASESLDCFNYIMKKYGMTYMEALGAINLDFNLGLRQEIITPSLNYVGLPDFKSKTKFVPSGDKSIRVKAINWSSKSLSYWEEYGISKKILNFYKVQHIDWYTINNIKFKAEEFTYSYYLGTNNGIMIYKIYSPFSKVCKWISNAKSNIFMGYDQLPLHGDLLVITKSMKDIMVLASHKIPSISPQSESVILEESFISLLKRRFVKVVILYDNDSVGKNYSNKNSLIHNLEEWRVPEHLLDSGIKDIADYSKKFGFNSTNQLINSFLYK